MANGKIRFGKQSGGQLALVIPDGVANTNLVLPESGTVASISATVTDNAIARYDGTTGKLQNSGVTIDTSGNLLLTSGSGGIGYGTGSGGSVTQLTSKSTTVTLNKPTGQITMNNSALLANQTTQFNFNNSLISVNDRVDIWVTSGTTSLGNYNVWAGTYGSNGIAYVELRNISAGSLSEAVVLNFNIIKGAIS